MGTDMPISKSQSEISKAYFKLSLVIVKIDNFQIERWWRELHDRLEKYFKDHLRWLKDQNH